MNILLKHFLSAYILVGGLMVPGVQAQTCTFVDRPSITAGQSNYANNRAPLLPNHFIKLPVGQIQLEGWLKKYLELQRDGLTGHLNEISAWLDKKNNAWLTTHGDHGWEEVPYWLKGYGNLAYILKDQRMIDEAKIWIEATLKSQRPDGSFGPINMKGDKPELWAQMIMLWCLQSYYEYSHDERVITLMTNYFKWELNLPDDKFLEDYWENSRGGDNLYSVYWLYNLTGEKFLLDLAEKIHRNTADWTRPSSLPNWHNVNIAQCFREPATYYQLTKDSAMLAATYNVHHLIRRTFGQVPGGMFGSDENCRLGYIDPRQGIETCGAVEQMASDELLLRMTGDPFWAENCEDVAFNTYPAAVMPDFKSLRYITCPNHVVSDTRNHHPGIDNSGPFLAMNPFSSRCCQHNHSQGWPYYVENLIYATPDRGIAVALYAACQTTVKVGNGQTIRLHEKTNYPFEDRVSFTIETDKAVHFPVYLRIPTWAQGASIYVNGECIASNAPQGKYACITRQWKNTDQIEISLPMQLTLQTWQVNKNSVSVNYGPLTFSLKIKEKYTTCDSKETAIGDSKWQEGADASKWPSYEIFPGSPWNYALVLDKENLPKGVQVIRRQWPADNFPFTHEGTPIEIKVKARKVPGWQIDEYGMCHELPEENAAKGEIEEVTLIPMGAARLRISAFPNSIE